MRSYLFFILVILVSMKPFAVFPGEQNQNLSLSGMVTASSNAGKQYHEKNVADNNMETLWKAKKSNAEQWLLIDLKSNYALNKISQTFGNTAVWKFKIEGSVDKQNWTMLVDKTKGASGISFAESVSGVYRYVRLTISGSGNNDIASSAEFAIYGTDKGTNIALGKYFNTHVRQEGFEPEKALDGDIATYWRASNTYPQTLTLDLRRMCMITGVRQVFKEHDIWKFKIEGSKDNQQWDSLLDNSQGDRGFDFSTSVSGDYHFIRLTILESSSGYIANSCEFCVYGFESDNNEVKPLRKNLAYNTAASTSSFDRNDYSQYKALDGNEHTFWRADDTSMPQWLLVDLGNSCQIDEISQVFTNEDTWKFKIEASNDKDNWTEIADETAGYTGSRYSKAMNGYYRYVKLTITDAENKNRAGSKELAIYGTGSPKTAKWWEDKSGMSRYYPKFYKQTFPSIIDSLDIIQAQGYNILEFSAPYEGDPEVWGGLGATNNYAIDPSIGTMEDFERLIKEAHARDMKVIFFGNVGYCWYEAPFFQKACDDERNKVDSKERKWFHFSQTKHSDSWFWSERAQAYYYSFWGNSDGAEGRIPNYNFNNQEWREECVNYLNFWSNKGVDGLLLDAPGAYDGINDAIIEENIVKVLNRHGIVTNAEGSGDVYHWMHRFGFNSIQGFDVYGWGGGKRSDILAGRKANTPRELDKKLKEYRDMANAFNDVTITPPMWEIPATEDERIFEVAYLTTLGTIFVNHYGDHHRDYIAQFIMSKWPLEKQKEFYDLVRTQNSYIGLAPYGQRMCLPTNDDEKYTAFKRTNKDGKVSALVIFNFQDAESTISVDLRNSGIDHSHAPIDLLTGKAAEPIISDKYEVSVPAYGYLILGVENEM